MSTQHEFNGISKLVLHISISSMQNWKSFVASVCMILNDVIDFMNNKRQRFHDAFCFSKLLNVIIMGIHQMKEAQKMH